MFVLVLSPSLIGLFPHEAILRAFRVAARLHVAAGRKLGERFGVLALHSGLYFFYGFRLLLCSFPMVFLRVLLDTFSMVF